LRDLAKLWIFKLIRTKMNFKKLSYDVISVTLSFSITEKRYQTNATGFFHFGLPIKISGYATVVMVQ